MNIENKKLYFLNQIILLIVLLLINAILINPVYAKTSDEWVTDGVSLLEIGEYSSALVAYDRAIAIDPDYEYAWIKKGNALEQLGKYEEAIIAYDRAIAINPDYEYAWTDKGLALEQLGKYEEAIIAHDRAIAINPDYEYAWTNKGLALYQLGKYEEAIIAYDRAIAIDPDDEYAWTNKGLALEQLGKYEEAIIAYDRAIAINPDYEYALICKQLADKILNVPEQLAVSTVEQDDSINLFTIIGAVTAIFIFGILLKKSKKSVKTIEEKQNDIFSIHNLSLYRETEFYQGFIRFKMSVTNNSSFVVNDVALDFDYDNNLLRIDRYEPDYQLKNGRTIFGNISGNSSKTIAVYFDPMMCSKGTDINCQVNYKDAKGQPQTTHMEPKKISVVCPIMETESDINIGRLKEFIEKLPYRDSKVYQVQNGFDIDVLKNISREIIQKHDVKHIRTLFTKDGDTCEIWYYGKTKVHGHDIVIKITILNETQNIELFAATQTVESLAGLLAEVGRELKSAIENKVTGNVQQVINVSIKDSIVQRSNLLSHCDIDGNCSGDVVIEDSLVQRSNISTVESENEGGSKEMDKDKVYNYLFDIVNNSSNIEDMKIEYKEVLSHFNRDTQSMPLLFNRLNEICRNNYERNEPLISAIVINEEPPTSGKGFFDNCMRKYRGYIGPSDGPEAQKIHNEELERVFNYWHDGNENSCPSCGEVVPDGAKFCMECGEKLA